MTDRLMNIEELAKVLGRISHATIYRHIKNISGFPQPVKIGAATRFRESEVQTYIKGEVPREVAHEQK